jgi:hypothetical protein
MAWHSLKRALLCFASLQCLRIHHRLFAHLSEASISIPIPHSNITLHICITPIANSVNRMPRSTCLTTPSHCIAGCRLCTHLSSIYALWTPRYLFISALHHISFYFFYLPSLSPPAAHGGLMSGTSLWFMCLFIFILPLNVLLRPLLSCQSHHFDLRSFHTAKWFLPCIVFSAILFLLLALYLTFVF